jgi:acyl carrier protein
MNTNEIEQRVKRVVARVLNVEDELVQPQSHFVFDLGAESVQSVQLVAAFEAEFGIEMDNEAALKVKTVHDAAEFIAAFLPRRTATTPA